MKERWAGLRVAGRILAALLFVAPIGWAVWASLQPLDRLYHAGEAEPPRWENYERAVTRLPFLRFMGNSLLIATAGTLGVVWSASLAGYAFARLRWRGRDACFVLLLACLVMPETVLLVPRFIVFRALGWVNTYKPLIVPAWLGGGAFYVLLFRQFFRAVPRELEDAARIDGASTWQVYRRIMMPIARPVVAAAACIAFVAHWHAFLDPLVYLSDFRTFPVSVGLRMYHALEGSWANLVLAASLLAMIPPVLVVLLCQKYLMRGLHLGGGAGRFGGG